MIKIVFGSSEYNLVAIQERFQSSHLSSLWDFSSSKGRFYITTQHHTPTPPVLVATVQPSLWQHLGQTLKARSTQLKTSLTPDRRPIPTGWWLVVATHWKKSTQVLYIPVRFVERVIWLKPTSKKVYVWNPIRNPVAFSFCCEEYPELTLFWKPGSPKKLPTNRHKNRGSADVSCNFTM